MSSEHEPSKFPWRLMIASTAAAMSLIALGLTFTWRVTTSNQFREQTASNCRQIELLKVAITDVLVDERNGVLKESPDPAVREAVQSYYDRQLARFAPDDCPNP